MRIFISGATGFLGKHLVDELISIKNHDITIFVRNKEKAYSLFGNNVKYCVAGFSEREKLRKSLLGNDIVYHLAGKMGDWGVTKEEYNEVNYEYTKIIIDESIISKIKQFILCSSSGVLGPLKKGIQADETFPANPSNYYEASKAKAEEYVFSKKNVIHVTILRPEFVFGEFDLHVLGLFKQINKSFFPLFNGGNSHLHPTYVKDVIAAFLLVLDNEKSFGETYIVSGEKPYTVKDIVTIIEKQLGKKVYKFYIPSFLGFIFAHLVEMLAKIVKIKPVLTISMVKYFTENRYYSSQKIQSLGINLTSFEEGVKKTIKYYKENKLLS